MDDEFEKIYEDLIDEHFNFDDNLLGNKIDDPEVLEMKFEEMVHDYDENKIQPINVQEVRHSKIPFRRRSEQSHIEKAVSEKGNDKKGKTGSSIPLLRSKSQHDTERTEVMAEIREARKEKTKLSSSIPLPRRKSGQDGDLSKTVYNKSEKDGVITKTVTTITKSAPVTQIKLEKGSISTISSGTNLADQQVNELYKNNEEQGENKTSVERSKIKKSIPRLIDSKHDGRKVIRTYTRTVTTEKVVSGKEKKLDEVNLFENPETKVELESSSSNTSNVEIVIGETMETQHPLQEENIVIKDSVKVAIPSFESKCENYEGNVQTVEVTKILEWNTNDDLNVSSPKFEAKVEVNENNIIKSVDKVDASLNENIVTLESCKTSIGTGETSQCVTEDNNYIKHDRIIRNENEFIKTRNILDKTIVSIKKDGENKDINVKEREGSRFNQVSNLTILKGIDHEETLKSPKLLGSANSESESNYKPRTPEEQISQDIKGAKVLEVLKSPKLDKDGNPDVLPEYNIRIKRYSREMKQIDDTLKQWQSEENLDAEDKIKTTEITNRSETKVSSNKVEISNMDNARNLLSRVLNRDIKTETVNTNEEINKNVRDTTKSKESYNDLSLTNKDNIRKNFKNNEISFEETVVKVQKISKEISNKDDNSKGVNTKTNEDTKELLHNNDENIEDLGIKGKVGKLITRIDSKEFNKDTVKKEEEIPIRRSVLSKVALFEVIIYRRYKRDGFFSFQSLH